MTDRNDTASFTINVTLPSDVIKTYFDGLAKVEAAKAKPSASSFNWSNLLPLVPLVVPFIQNLSTQNATKSKDTKTKSVAAKDPATESPPVTGSPPATESSAGSKDTPAVTSEKSALPEAVLEDMASGLANIIASKEGGKDVATVVMAAATDAVEMVSGVVSQSGSESCSQTVSDTLSAIRKPESSTSAAPPNLNDMLSQAGGLEGMFKQFMPMLEGFKSAFAPPNQAAPESSSSTPESSSSTPESSSSAPAPVSTPKKEVQPEEANKEANEEAPPAQSPELNQEAGAN